MMFNNKKTVEEIAQLINATVVGDGTLLIESINRIEDAARYEITFIADNKYKEFLHESKASAVIVSKEFNCSEFESHTFLVVENPRKSINFLLNYISELLINKKRSYIHPTAIIGNNSVIDNSAYIGAYSVIGDNCKIEENVILLPACVLNDNVTIQKNTILNAKVVCYDNVHIGEDCIIHSGAIIGSDGFGFEEQADGSFIKIPQLGNVRIGNRVEIGANTTVDRALLGSTIIENGVKLDNLIQIAHNVTVGENSAMASQVGISGSTRIGKRNRIGGQTGMAGHIKTTDDVVLLARTGVAKSIEVKGQYFGAPARERMRAFKIEAVINNLPELKREITQLSKKIEKIENISDTKSD